MKTTHLVRATYPTDISIEQFNSLKELFDGFRKKTRPRQYELFDIFCAVLYVLKTGCQWRSLPHDYPKWSNVYSHFIKWGRKYNDKPSFLEICMQKLVSDVRLADGRAEHTTYCIVDAQSVKNTDTAKEKGYDAGKNVSGIKRHIAVDTQGLPHAIAITTADVTDRNGALLAIGNAKDNLSEVKKICGDGGYSGEKFAESIKKLIGAEVEIVKRNDVNKFVVLAKRWVVERTFAWLDKCRRLWKNCERKIHNSLQMVILAFIAIFIKR
jgi:transposase